MRQTLLWHLYVTAYTFLFGTPLLKYPTRLCRSWYFPLPMRHGSWLAGMLMPAIS